MLLKILSSHPKTVIKNEKIIKSFECFSWHISVDKQTTLINKISTIISSSKDIKDLFFFINMQIYERHREFFFQIVEFHYLIAWVFFAA